MTMRSSITSHGTRTRTYEQRLAGDANDDGVFNSSDLVEIFQSGKYQTARAATFDEGDWNGDRIFDSSDLVSAFQAGHYEQPNLQAFAKLPIDLFDRRWNERQLRLDPPSIDTLWADDEWLALIGNPFVNAASTF